MSSDKAWSCQELVDHADNWSLAGNVGLFKHMEEFAEDLFRKADETNNNLENLLEDLNRTEIRLDLVKNQFLSLQNTQFIESRVYEDDETVSEVIVEKAEAKLDDGRKKELLKSAVVDGLKVLDRHFERVSIPESDSEGDETDCSNYVLREKDPYIGRPLPYVIGTAEWHTKWHAGLQESSDEEDGDDADVRANGDGRVEDEFSDTDSESHLPVADRRVAHHDDADVKTATFAEQLVEKLEDVFTTDPEVNTRPIQRKPPAAGSSLMPVDQFGTFSGGGGLFDDDSAAKPPPITSNRRKVPNLFDEDDDDDDDAPIATNRTHVEEKKRIGGLFDESDGEDEAESARKPVGGVNVLGGFLPRRRASSSSSSSDDAARVVTENVPPPLSAEDDDDKANKRVLSLFDDTDDLFEDDLFAPTSEAKKASLFDDDEDEANSLPPPLFAGAAASERRTKTRNLFDESSEDEDDDDMFAAPIALPTKTVGGSGLFDVGADVFGEKPNAAAGDTDGMLFVDETVKDEITANVVETVGDGRSAKPRFSLFDDKPPSLLSDDDEWQESAVPQIPARKTHDKLETDVEASKTVVDVAEANVEEIVSSKEGEERATKPMERSPEKKLPGRLKHNLNINVNALVPGARMPKTPVDAIQPVEATEAKTSDENVVGTTTDDVNILRSVTKTRAKIQVKRRPSTRQGRKAALRSSQVDAKTEDEKQEVPSKDDFAARTKAVSLFAAATNASTPRKQLIVEDGEVAARRTVEAKTAPPTAKKISLFDDPNDHQDSDDLFAAAPPAVANVRVYDNAMPAAVRSGSEARKVAAKGGLFGEDDGGDLFAAEKRASKTVATKSLFGDDDDDDDDGDLFGDVSAKARTKPSASRLPDNKTTSLFGDDDDDDDDIFNAKSAKRTNVGKPAAKASSSVAGAKLSTSVVKSDPLADLFGDGD